jgi:hypothetical protein
VHDLDLANAYGSVKHALLHFSLEWYHVPIKVRELFFSYYERLIAKVLVNSIETDWFWFMIGVFQGCTLSTILFITAFNTIFGHMKELKASHSYTGSCLLQGLGASWPAY